MTLQDNIAAKGKASRSFSVVVSPILTLKIPTDFRQDYADWSSRVEKAQQEKSKLDAVLRGLNDEVLHQGPML